MISDLGLIGWVNLIAGGAMMVIGLYLLTVPPRRLGFQGRQMLLLWGLLPGGLLGMGAAFARAAGAMQAERVMTLLQLCVVLAVCEGLLWRWRQLRRNADSEARERLNRPS